MISDFIAMCLALARALAPRAALVIWDLIKSNDIYIYIYMATRRNDSHRVSDPRGGVSRLGYMFHLFFNPSGWW